MPSAYSQRQYACGAVMRLLYDSGPNPILVRIAACVIAVAFFAMTAALLVSIPFPAVPRQPGSVSASLVGAALAAALGVIIGTAGLHTVRIAMKTPSVVEVSHGWIFGTLSKCYDVGAIDRFEYELRSASRSGSFVRYNVCIVLKDPKAINVSTATQNSTRTESMWEDFLRQVRCQIDLVYFSDETEAANLVVKLNHAISMEPIL